MAAKKRKPVRAVARKAVKKTTAKVRKKPAVKAKTTRKSVSSSKASPKKAQAQERTTRAAPVTSVDKAFTKGQLFSILAGRTGLQRRDVITLFEELRAIIQAHVKKQGPGQFTLPGLVKLTVTHKPATKARKGINPFTGEEMMFKAKPARNVVKARALKQLKEMVA